MRPFPSMEWNRVKRLSFAAGLGLAALLTNIAGSRHSLSLAPMVHLAEAAPKEAKVILTLAAELHAAEPAPAPDRSDPPASPLPDPPEEPAPAAPAPAPEPASASASLASISLKPTVSGKQLQRWTAAQGLVNGELAGVTLSDEGVLRLDPAGLRRDQDDVGLYHGERYFYGTVLSPVYETGRPVQNIVPSWEAATPPGTWVQAELSVRVGGGWTSWYNLGVWAAENRTIQRRSVNGQSDRHAKVATDTLLLTRPADALRYRLTLFTTSPAVSPVVQAFSLALLDPNAPRPPASPTVRALGAHAPDATATGPARRAWGMDLAVPERSQMVYPDGEGWCSPTSLSMVLAYWAGQPGGNPGWNQPVPVVAAHTWDRTYRGNGNWPFNTAYAAHWGLRAVVSRLDSLGEVEEWIAAGLPVIASVAWTRGDLTGAPIAASDGHLLVIRGFTEAGDVIVNDPAGPNDASVRRVYRRSQFEQVWLGRNHGLVYFIAPPGHALPEDRWGHWE